MLDLFINIGVGVLSLSFGFYQGYGLGHVNGRIHQIEKDEEFDKLSEEGELTEEDIIRLSKI